MSAVALGLVLALGASVALNAAFLLQHAGSVGAPAVTLRRPLATLRSLLGSRLWAGGAALGFAGWAMHIGALARAPLSLVQAFVAGGLALCVPMAAVGLGHRATPAERRAAVLMVAGLVLLAYGLKGAHRDAAFAPPLLAAYLGALVLGAAAVTALPHGAVRPMSLGLAGGVLYGAADLAVKASTGVAGDGAVALLTSPWPTVAVVLTVGAFFAFQRGLQTGRPIAVIALMTAATNVASIAGGFLVFGDPIGATRAAAAAHVVGFALVGVAAWRLAPAQAALTTAPTDVRRVSTAGR